MNNKVKYLINEDFNNFIKLVNLGIIDKDYATDAVIETHDAHYIYSFARKIKGADIKRLENAIIKAKEVYKITKIPTIADDSGLEITALNNFPGVLTNPLLKMMEGKTDRTCYFVCSFAYFDGINLETSEYRLKGTIADSEKIGNGFGFDSIFLYNGKYLSEMTLTEKNQISPRRIALEKLKESENLQKNVDFRS